MSDSVPTGKLARSGIASSAMLKAGKRQLTHAAKRPFLSEAARQAEQQQLDDDTPWILFQRCSEPGGGSKGRRQLAR
jgi:hypothetical protein